LPHQIDDRERQRLELRRQARENREAMAVLRSLKAG